MKSLERRLNLSFIAITVVVFMVVWFAHDWVLRQAAYEFVSSRMNSDAHTLLKSVEMKPGGGWQVNPHYISPNFQRPMSGHYFKIAVDGEWLHSRSLWDGNIPHETGITIGEQNVRLIYKGDKPMLVLDEIFMKDGLKVHLVLGEDVSVIDNALKKLSWLVIGVGVGFLVILLCCQMWVVRKGLGSLSDVRLEISLLKQGEIRQLTDSDTLEVEPLVTEINYLVQNMEVRLQRSRNAVGNLAHAAKTPLTVLDRQIEALELLDHDRAQAFREQSVRLRELMERELTRARIAGAALPGQRVYLQQELEKLQRTMLAIYRDRDLDIELRLSEKAWFPGERDDLLELLGNLLDNACKWASSKVRVTAMMDEDCLHLVIEDDGPGIPPEKINQMLTRGERLDESRSGHGLGMSIVVEIVNQYSGKLALEKSEYQGLKAALMLPLRTDIELPEKATT